MMKIHLHTVIICTISLIVASCSSPPVQEEEEDYKNVSLRKLTEKPHKYDGKTIVVSGYVLGTEYNPSEDGAQFFILTIGERPRSTDSAEQKLIFTKEKHKVRAAEDGYNAGILKSCYIMAENARKLGIPITIIGDFTPDKEFYYYETGISLFIRQMKVGDRTVNTDYGDKSKLAHSTPGFIKRVYQGGKKLFKLTKNLIN